MLTIVARLLVRLAPAATVLAFLTVAPASAQAQTACDRLVGPGGSVQDLVDELEPGETGCVRGRVVGDVKMTRGGRPGARITVTSEPGQRGTIHGRLWIADGADFVSVTDLDLDGRNGRRLPSPVIHGNDAHFRGNDITNKHTSICVSIGAATYKPQVTTHRTVIEDNRIHNCGVLPAKNHDHGIYVEKARDTRIADNVIYDNADRAINLYPDAQRTLVVGNIMDGNGQGVLFSGDLGFASNDNVVRGNVISNPRIREAVESWYPDGHRKGVRNVVEDNCIGGGSGDIDVSEGGVRIGQNLIGAPDFLDRGRKDFRLRPGSACAAILSGVKARPARALAKRRKSRTKRRMVLRGRRLASARTARR